MVTEINHVCLRGSAATILALVCSVQSLPSSVVRLGHRQVLESARETRRHICGCLVA
jgi:hypothetical protein